MTDVVSLDDVGRVVCYVAPGFLAQSVYRARFPSRDRPAGELLILSIVLSVPFVALARELAPGTGEDPTSLRFVAALLLPALLAGFFSAVARPAVRDLFGALGYDEQPEGSMWQRTLQDLPRNTWVTVEFVDGSKVAGLPRTFPGASVDGVRELYLVAPRYEDDGRLVEVDGAAGVIVRLDEVRAVTLGRDATGALS